MKYSFLAFLAFLVFSIKMNAQYAKVSNIIINTVSQPCVMAEYEISADMIEGALRKKFSDAKLGSGDKTKDGFRVYKGVVISDIAKEKVDVYYKVEDKKPLTDVYLLVSKGYDNFIKNDPDSVTVKNAMTYLDLFVKDATAFLLNDQIVKQNEAIKNLEKDSKRAAKEGASLQKSKLKTTSKISKNAIEAGALKTEMENQQKAFELAKTKTATLEDMNILKKEVNAQESLTKKATKNYDNAVKDGAEFKEDLSKTEKEMVDNQALQEKIKSDIETAKQKTDELKNQLKDLK